MRPKADGGPACVMRIATVLPTLRRRARPFTLEYTWRVFASCFNAVYAVPAVFTYCEERLIRAYKPAVQMVLFVRQGKTGAHIEFFRCAAKRTVLILPLNSGDLLWSYPG
jgi:hypothetical protein